MNWKWIQHETKWLKDLERKIDFWKENMNREDFEGVSRRALEKEQRESCDVLKASAFLESFTQQAVVRCTAPRTEIHEKIV